MQGSFEAPASWCKQAVPLPMFTTPQNCGLRLVVKLPAPLPLLFIRLGPMATRRSVIAPLLFLNLRTSHRSFLRLAQKVGHKSGCTTAGIHLSWCIAYAACDERFPSRPTYKVVGSCWIHLYENLSYASTQPGGSTRHLCALRRQKVCQPTRLTRHLCVLRIVARLQPTWLNLHLCAVSSPRTSVGWVGGWVGEELSYQLESSNDCHVQTQREQHVC